MDDDGEDEYDVDNGDLYSNDDEDTAVWLSWKTLAILSTKQRAAFTLNELRRYSS